MEKLLLGIPIENIGLTDHVQTLSLFAIFSVFLIPFFLIFFKLKKSNLLSTFLILIVWLLFSTFFNIIFRSEVQDNLLRPLIGIAIGFSIFVLLREIFYRSSEYSAFVWLKYSYMIILISSLYDLISKFPERSRIYASYTEPSHLGTDLALIYFPLFLLYSNFMNRTEKIFLFFSLFLIVVLTFSATTILKIVFFIMLFYLFTMKNFKYTFYIIVPIVAIFIILIFVSFKLFPDNYLIHMMKYTIENIEKGYEHLPVSFTDRFSFWIFLLNLKNLDFSMELLIKFLIGGGLGEELLYLEFLPINIVDQILSVKAFTSYITSFSGRIFSYGGIIGIILYFTFLFFVHKNIKRISSTPKEKAIFNAWLITLLFSSTFDLAPFQTVSLWFLPAYIDGLSLKYKKHHLIITSRRKSYD
ncbi:MAG: O-antigen polymerase [Thermodesulfobacteriaceae bacterium]|jgi:hypothetical protein